MDHDVPDNERPQDLKNFRNPRALTLIGVSQIISGVIAIFDITISLRYGRVYPDLALIGLWSGTGLLNRSHGWWRWTVGWSTFTLFCLPLVAVWACLSHTPLTFTFFGMRVPYPNKQICLFALACSFVMRIWVLRILTSPEIRQIIPFASEGPLKPSWSQPKWGGPTACYFLISFWFFGWGLALYCTIATGRLRLPL